MDDELRELCQLKRQITLLTRFQPLTAMLEADAMNVRIGSVQPEVICEPFRDWKNPFIGFIARLVCCYSSFASAFNQGYSQ